MNAMNAFVNVEIRCPFCGATHYVLCAEDEFDRWQAGELIQVAMTTLSPTEREALISGMCANCQSVFFSGEDEEEDEDEDWEPDVDETGFDPYEGWYTYDC